MDSSLACPKLQRVDCITGGNIENTLGAGSPVGVVSCNSSWEDSDKINCKIYFLHDKV